MYSNISFLFPRLLRSMQGPPSNTVKVRATGVGRRKGLRVLLDQQYNTKSFGSVPTDNKGLQVTKTQKHIIEKISEFQVFIGGRTEFPLVKERGLIIRSLMCQSFYMSQSHKCTIIQYMFSTFQAVHA